MTLRRMTHFIEIIWRITLKWITLNITNHKTVHHNLLSVIQTTFTLLIVILPSFIMLNAVILSVVKLRVILPSFFHLSAVILRVILLTVILLNPFCWLPFYSVIILKVVILKVILPVFLLTVIKLSVFLQDDMAPLTSLNRICVGVGVK